MSDSQRTRGNSRNRHGRSVRRILSALYQPGGHSFTIDRVVASTCEFLKAAWPEELSKLSWQVLDAPALLPDAKKVRRWAVDREKFKIIIYRVPIERLTHHRRTDLLDERMHIEQFVFSAVGHLVGKDPFDLIPENYKR